MEIMQIGEGSVRMPPDRGGGADMVIFDTAKNMVKLGHEVTILDRKYLKSDPCHEDREGIHIIRLAVKYFNFGWLAKIRRVSHLIYFMRLILNEITFARKVRGYFGRNATKYDVIHTHYAIVALILIMGNRSVATRMFYTSHLPTWLSARQPLGLMHRSYIMLEAFVMRRVRKVVALNEPMRANIIAVGRVKPENTVISRIGVDTELFRPDIALDNIKERYGLGEGINILFVGRITEFKGVEYLIRAASIIINEYDYKQARFLLVGPFKGFGMTESPPDAYVNRVLQLVKDNKLEDNVRLTGSVPFDDLTKLFAACDLFVLPSLAEADPAVSLQAMACGKPIVATNVGGLPTQIQDGHSGFLVAPANKGELAERIKYLIDNPQAAKMMGEKGRRIATEQFDWRSITEKLVRIYKT